MPFSFDEFTRRCAYTNGTHTLASIQDDMQAAVSDEQRINLCKAAIVQIYSMLRDDPQSWRNYIGLARSVVAHLDTTAYMQDSDNITEQAWIITGIQRIAFTDPDNGAVTDLDTWSARQWLTILQEDTRNVIALRGLGWAWLQRAQPALARIQRLDGGSSSSGGSVATQALAASVLGVDENLVMEQANAEAERRSGTADYVEARGVLQPSIEYMARAVSAALSQHVRSGELLSTAAEAFMSMGNASSPRINEAHFRRAVQLLRAASNIEGYTLPSHLQHYLDDFGRLVD